ncbi:tryptophan synthase subunit alpha [Buchnera aphidicola]|uniref:tryptophan synthase subunit alpha n=1 Tax=Buchnera aphidicola TaxID=9 RepID=UPI0030ECA1FB
MNRYKKMFLKLSKKKEKCFIPFIILGDPNLKISILIIKTLIKNGADALEIGFPFSDPLSDGIIIQKSHKRALRNKISIKKLFLSIKKIRLKYSKIPIGVLIYSNLIFNYGIKKFYSKCSQSGIDSTLIPDVPLVESYEFEKYALKKKICSIFICPPNASKNLIKKICLKNQGYIYLTSQAGVTGIKKKLSFTKNKNIKNLINHSHHPVVQGFGIATKKHIRKILKTKISGVICGSVIIKKILKYKKNTKKMLIKIKKLILKLKSSTILNNKKKKRI